LSVIRGFEGEHPGDCAALQVGQPFNPYRLFTGIFIPEALVRNPNISAGAKLAYGRLARYAGERGDCHPSVKALAREIGVKERQAQRYLAELETNGFIRAHPRYKGGNIRDTNSYAFLWHETFSGSIRKTPPPGVRCDTTPVSNTTPPSASLVTPKESLKEESQQEESHSSSPEIYGGGCLPPPTPSPIIASARRGSIMANIDDDATKRADYNGNQDELIALIQESTGETPDSRLIRDITEGLELRGIPLLEYLNDVTPRIRRLRERVRPGFFVHHIRKWQDSRPARKRTVLASSKCLTCSGGRTLSGYCICATGRDLARVEARIAKEKGLLPPSNSGAELQ
jgi:hypothetical protein